MKVRTIFVFMLLVSGFSFAQTAAPESRASAERLLEVLQVGENFDNTIRRAATMSFGMLDKRADIPDDKKEMIRKSAEAAANNTLEKMSWQKMKGMFIDIYASVFTKEELDGVIAFYESPAGQKFVAKQPELTLVTMQKMQALMAEIMPEIQKNAEKAVAQAKAEMDAKQASGQ